MIHHPEEDGFTRIIAPNQRRGLRQEAPAHSRGETAVGEDAYGSGVEAACAGNRIRVHLIESGEPSHANPEYQAYAKARTAFKGAFEQCLAARGGASS